MLILNVIDNGLACDCGDSRALVMTYHRFCKKYFRSNTVSHFSYAPLIKCKIFGKEM